LETVAQSTIDTCYLIINEFECFCEHDPMINFDVPDKIGIGLSRGTACRLISDDKILDYSGDTLNLATKLMDFARPEGIVFDAKFGFDLLSRCPEKLV